MNNKIKTTHKKLNKKRLKRKRKFRFLFGILCVFIIIGGIYLTEGDYVSKLVNGSENKPFILQTNSEIIKNDWRLILVNRWNPIPDDYKVSLVKLKNGESVDERIYADLQEMFDNARNVGIYPMVSSGYRTTQTQQDLFDEKLKDFKSQGYSSKEAEIMTEKWVAIPGSSEHQIGLAIDVVGEDSQDNAKVQQWLKENSFKYGFILRYSSDKTDITGTNFEPWHFRYVGKENAFKIYESGLCLEQYLESLNK